MDVRVNLDNSGISQDAVNRRREEATAAIGQLWSGEMKYTSWLQHPSRITDEELNQIEDAANRIRQSSDLLLVLGVGGSYMGAKAVIDLLAEPGNPTAVHFVGYNFSGRYMNEIFREMEGKDVSLCVISKSGSTMETLASYNIYEKWMREKYGEAASDRIYIITESETNELGRKAQEDHIRMLKLNPDIGGRYSVMTAVGLLPIAVAGVDIRQFLEGAKAIANESAFSGENANRLDYAIVRQALYQKGKHVEVFETFDPYFNYFGEWLKQLFGESEGKGRKGIFPTSLIFSRDLHSMGQFLQEGTECFFETLINVDELDEALYPDYEIPEGLVDYLAGKTINQINRCAQQGVWDAHVQAGISVIEIAIPKMDAYHIGELMYFFEVECAVSSMLAGVCPFDQPGVEAYKEATRNHIQAL